MKQVTLYVWEYICSLDKIRLALFLSWEAKVNRSLAANVQNPILSKTWLVFIGINLQLIVWSKNKSSQVLNLSSSARFLQRSVKLDISLSYIK